VIRIALDAMGGDNAPNSEVAGVALALAELPPTFLIQLVGRAADIGRSGPIPTFPVPASRSWMRPRWSGWARSRSRP
jgi:hypothetical protein